MKLDPSGLRDDLVDLSQMETGVASVHVCDPPSRDGKADEAAMSAVARTYDFPPAPPPFDLAGDALQDLDTCRPRL